MYPDERNVEVIVISNLPIPSLTVDRLVTLRDLLNEGSRWERAWRETGILPLGARDLHKAFPTLWMTVEVARKALQRAGVNGDNLLIGSISKMSPLTLAYRLKNQRGPRDSVAIMDATRHPDPRAALEAVVGPLAAFSVVGDTVAEPVALVVDAVAEPAAAEAAPVALVVETPIGTTASASAATTTIFSVGGSFTYTLECAEQVSIPVDLAAWTPPARPPETKVEELPLVKWLGTVAYIAGGEVGRIGVCKMFVPIQDYCKDDSWWKFRLNVNVWDAWTKTATTKVEAEQTKPDQVTHFIGAASSGVQAGDRRRGASAPT